MGRATIFGGKIKENHIRVAAYTEPKVSLLGAVKWYRPELECNGGTGHALHRLKTAEVMLRRVQSVACAMSSGSVTPLPMG